MRAMLGLTDNQLDTVMDAARAVPVERRDVYLQRIGAMLRAAAALHRLRRAGGGGAGVVRACAGTDTINAERG